MRNASGWLRGAVLILSAALLSGCDLLVLNPPGDVAARQGDLIVVATLLMLIVIVPVIALTFWFAWRYRASNTQARYTPDWDHSTQLELVIWGVPLLIIIALGAVTWISTHLLDPYRPLDRIAEGRPVPKGMEHLEVQVVALDWKWLFIYPEQGIAVVNQLVFPAGRPVSLRITSDTVMNSFYVPQLAGQIYAMAGMQTRLQMLADQPGTFVGRNSQYSGGGYSQQHFEVKAMSQADFDAWVARAKQGGTRLDATTYPALAARSRANPITYYSTVEPNLFDSIIDKYRHSGHAHSAPVRR